MATITELSENSHQGFDGLKATLCPASMDAKSNTASGLPVCLRQEGTGSRCSGKERDETGLDYFGARYFSAALGRFTSPDPQNAGVSISDPHSWNAYAYSRNNPLKYNDPDGKRYLLTNDQGYSGEIEDWRFWDDYWDKWWYTYAKGSTRTLGSFTDTDGVTWHYKNFYSEHDEDDIANKDDHIISDNAANFAIGLLFKKAIFGVAGLLDSLLLPDYIDDPTAEQIAEGHAWTEHQNEFPGWSKRDFKKAVGETVNDSNDFKQLARGRQAFWNEKEKMVVIHDPNSVDGGTAFRPVQGKAYFDNLK